MRYNLSVADDSEVENRNRLLCELYEEALGSTALYCDMAWIGSSIGFDDPVVERLTAQLTAAGLIRLVDAWGTEAFLTPEGLEIAEKLAAKDEEPALADNSYVDIRGLHGLPLTAKRKKRLRKFLIALETNLDQMRLSGDVAAEVRRDIVILVRQLDLAKTLIDVVEARERALDFNLGTSPEALAVAAVRRLRRILR
jgi:hypothetical protein